MSLDINWGFLIAQLVNAVLFGVYLYVLFRAMRRISQQTSLAPSDDLLWRAVIVFLPLLGAVWVLMRFPGNPKQADRSRSA